MKQKNTEVHKFFLACEFKPGSMLWSVLEPFAYEIKPAYIYGSLGVIAYEPESYSIIDVSEDNPPLMGYVMTITHPETVILLDKIKGYYGKDAFNAHHKIQVKTYTGLGNGRRAWCYILGASVLDSYQQIEQIEFGIWDSDEQQINLLEKIGESNP